MFPFSTSCCGCTSLRKGTLTIGILSLIGNLAITCYTIIGLFMSPYTGSNLGSQVDMQQLFGLWIVAAVLAFLQAVCSCLVIYSARVNGRPKLLLPWIVTSLITIAFTIIVGIYLLIILSGTRFSLMGFDNLYFPSISGICSSVISVYFALVVYSYYAQFGSSCENV